VINRAIDQSITIDSRLRQGSSHARQPIGSGDYVMTRLARRRIRVAGGSVVVLSAFGRYRRACLKLPSACVHEARYEDASCASHQQPLPTLPVGQFVNRPIVQSVSDSQSSSYSGITPLLPAKRAACQSYFRR
jgi:hypothetical protein